MLHRLLHLTSQVHTDFDRNLTQTEENGAKFKVTDYYVNNSDYDLVVVPRNNVPVFIAKNIRPPTNNQRLSITRRYKFKDMEALAETYKMMKEFRTHHGCEHTELKIVESILRANNADTNRNPRFDIDVRYEIHLDRFDEHGRAYDRRTDLTIALSNKYHYLPHPYSEIGRGHEEYTDYINSKKGTGVFMEIVDNNNLIPKRYTYIANELKEVYPVQDPTKNDGIYITRFCHEKSGEIKMEVQVLALSEGESIGLYPTREEALTNGKTDEGLRNESLRLSNQKLILDTESLKVKGELQEQLKEFNREKADFDKEILKARTEEFKVKQEIEEQKHKLEERKQELEKELLEHKAHMDNQKHILEERKREIEKEAQESDARIERQKAKLEEDALRTKMEYIKIKDNIDERSLHRSEIMENLKFVTMMVTSLLSLYFVLKK